MARLTYKRRKGMPKSSFAIPSKKTQENPAGRGAYPIQDVAHARNALARVSAHGTPAEKATVKRKVYSRYPGLKARKQAR